MSEWAHVPNRLATLSAMVVSISWGCSEVDVGRGSFTTRDSAGVVIVENHNPAWASGAGWRVSSVALLSIGLAEGDSTHQLYQVTAAARLAPDTIVIVNAGTSEVRWYDADGHFIRSIGRQGAGPGEFSRMGPGSMCVLPERNLLIADPIQQRANVFTPAGEFVDVIRLAGDAAFPSIQGCFADGSLLGWRSVGSPERVPGTIIQSQFVWSRLGADGERIADLASLPSSPQYLLDQGDGTATYHTIPFTVRPSAAAGPDRLYSAPGGPPLIETRRLDGSLEMAIRWEPAERVKSAEVLERYRSYTIDSQDRPDRRSQWSKFFDLDLEAPEDVASVQTLKVDDLGHVWAERYRLPWDSSAIWDVFTPEGRWLGGVGLPPGLRPLHIGGDFVLGVSRDELGVERVKVHGLDRIAK